MLQLRTKVNIDADLTVINFRLVYLASSCTIKDRHDCQHSHAVSTIWFNTAIVGELLKKLDEPF